MPNNVTFRVGAKGAAQASSELDKLKDKWTRLQQQGAKGIAIGAGAAVTAKGLNLVTQGLADVTNFMADSIQKASDLNETMNKSEVVFGSSAKQIDAWGNTAARAMGQSKQQALEAAATFGNLFESMGVGQQRASDLSMKMVQLASDLASFNNIDPTEALQKLQSGIVGETKAVRDLGIDLSETTVNQELLREGVKKTGGEYTNAQKIIARYNLIVQQTGNAQGDFARTADGLANSQRIAAAEIDDLSAKLGQDLIPIQKLGLGVLDDTVGALSQVIGGFNDYAAAVKHAADEHQGFIDALLGGKPTEEQRNERTAQFLPFLRQVGSGYGDLADTIPRVTDAGKALDDVFKPLVTDTYHASEATGDYISWLWQLADAAKPAKESVDDLGSALEDKLFGAAERKGHRAQLVQNVIDLRKELKGTKDDRAATILRGQIAEAEQALFDFDLQAAEKKGPAALIDFLKHAKDKFKDADKATRDLIDKLLTLASVSKGLPNITYHLQTGGGTGSHIAMAEGGVVKARPGGTLALLAEAGHDEAVVPLSGPNAPVSAPTAGHLGGLGGGDLIINVSGVSVLTPGSAEALARQLEPVISRAQQRRGLLPARVGAF